MIVPDLNLLIHAYHRGSAKHREARSWWERLLNGSTPVGLAWVTMLGFLRITTHRGILDRPMPVHDACQIARSWLARPTATILHPGDRHATVLFGLLETLGTAGNLTSDAHLAALAIEYQAELHTTDADFARFPGLRWRNPLR